MIVIDVGCSPAGGDSIGYLQREFKPEILYGFDPSPAVQKSGSYELDGTQVIVERKAAWIRDGWMKWVPYGYGKVTEEEGVEGQSIRCFDFSDFVLSLGQDDLVLKMDIEGAEYPILERMIQTGAMDRVKILWLEWHFFEEGDAARKDAIVGALSCEIHSWNL